MKQYLLRMGTMLWLLGVTGLSAEARQLLPEYQARAGDITRANALQDFRVLLTSAIEGRDYAAVQDLYQPGTLSAVTLAAEFTRWRELFKASGGERVNFWGKDLERLPSQQARTHWTAYASRLTDRRVTHLMFVSISHGNSFRMDLPLVLVGDRLWLVPSDKGHVDAGVKAGAPKAANQPTSAGTNAVVEGPVVKQ